MCSAKYVYCILKYVSENVCSTDRIHDNSHEWNSMGIIRSCGHLSRSVTRIIIFKCRLTLIEISVASAQDNRGANACLFWRYERG